MLHLRGYSPPPPTPPHPVGGEGWMDDVSVLFKSKMWDVV